MGSLATFLGQAVDVLVLNTVLGKMTAKESKEQVIQNAHTRGVKVNNGPLSALNFANALKTLPRLQAEFRKRFAAFIDARRLSQIERERKRPSSGKCGTSGTSLFFTQIKDGIILVEWRQERQTRY
jgi:hypothetical protein